MNLRSILNITKREETIASLVCKSQENTHRHTEIKDMMLVSFKKTALVGNINQKQNIERKVENENLKV